MKKKILWFLIGAVVSASITTLVFELLLVARENAAPPEPVVTLTNLPNISLLEDSSVLEITGQCQNDCESVNLFVDHKKQYSIPVTEHHFQDSFAISGLTAGWHFISVDSRNDPEGSEQPYAWVHIIPGQAHVLLPHDALIEARSYSNRNKRSYSGDRVENYRPLGRYFGFSPDEYRNSNLPFDSEGIPLTGINNGKNYAYNPTTISQYALSLYNAMLQQTDSERNETKKSFVHVAAWLAEHQEENGSFPYAYTFFYKPDLPFQKGFVSGMAQGQLLSVYARAYNLTKDPVFLEAGQKCLRFMVSPADSETGGTAVTLKAFTDHSPALKPYENYVLFDEYIAQPQTYVLNGNLFALIGLYDWAHTIPEQYGAKQAQEAFEQGCKAVEVILPYYDYNGFSAYDILPFTSDYDPYFSSSYAHACHIYLLNTLAELTGNPTFSTYYLRFKSYSDSPFYKQTETFLPPEPLQETLA